MAGSFDAIVIGAGPGGEVVVEQLLERGLELALVERELIGGECAYWACIPSKTLLRAPEIRSEATRAAGATTPALRWRELSEYRDFMIRNLDDSDQVEAYEGKGVKVFKGAARLAGPGQVEVGGQALGSQRIVVATGTVPRIPPIAGLAEAGYWTSREATTIKEIPASVAILGGGPVGIEFALLFRRLGAEVSLIESADRVLAREDPRVGELLCETLREEGVEVAAGVEVASVSLIDQRRVIKLEDGTEVSAEQMIVASGRSPRVEGLGLESVGVTPTERGIDVDERCRAADGIWAVGDVTGVMPFTHVAKYQARIAVTDIAGEQARADYAAVPRVVFSDPEVAAVGMIAQQARSAGVEVATARLRLPDAIARPWTYESEPRGELELVADRGRGVLVGAWAVAPLASEWIHYAALAIKAEIPLAVLRDTVSQFPTYNEAYFKALELLEA